MEAYYRLLTLTVVCAVTLWSSARCGVVKVASCDNGKPEQLEVIKGVRVAGGSEQPCIMKKNHNYTVEIDIVPKASSKTLTVGVQGELFGIKVNWMGFQKDACKFGHVTCPIAAGNQFTYKYDVTILSFYPSMNLFSYWAIHDDTSQIACFKVNQTLIA